MIQIAPATAAEMEAPVSNIPNASTLGAGSMIQSLAVSQFTVKWTGSAHERSVTHYASRRGRGRGGAAVGAGTRTERQERGGREAGRQAMGRSHGTDINRGRGSTPGSTAEILGGSIAHQTQRIAQRSNGGPQTFPLPTMMRLRSAFNPSIIEREQQMHSDGSNDASQPSANPSASAGRGELIGEEGGNSGGNQERGSQDDTALPPQEETHWSPEEGRHTYTVIVAKVDDVQRYCCTCLWSRSTGIPCAHLLRVAIVYREKMHADSRLKSISGARIGIEKFFSPILEPRPFEMGRRRYCRTEGKIEA